MTTEYSLKIYEILQLHFKSSEEAREVVKAIESISETKVEEKTEKIAVLINKDIEYLRMDLHKTFATKEDLGILKVDMIKWVFAFFATLAIMVVGLYFKK